MEKFIAKTNNNKKIPTHIYALGGLGEVGKNMYVFEHGNEIWIIDAGIMFPHVEELSSIEGIIQSFEHLKKNERKIRGLIITHAHEDHIGGIPYLVKNVRIPIVYTQKLGKNLIGRKLRNKGVANVQIRTFTSNKKIKSYNFEISFFNVNHSIPESVGVKLKTSNGIFVTTGDFKFDMTPLGHKADFSKITSIGDENVTVLLSDSTNALIPGFSTSESDVKQTIEKMIKNNSEHRIIIATFASNVYRTTNIVMLAKKYNKKVLILGYSMEFLIQASRNIGYLNVENELLIDGKDIRNKKIKNNEYIVLCTGTQGEPLAALSKMANGLNKDVKINNDDIVIFSSSAIPGAFRRVEKVTNNLVKKGAKVYNNKEYPMIHTTGHGSRSEQMLMLNLLRPKYFMPIHGEFRMLHGHKQTAIKTGIPKENIFVMANGIRLSVLNGQAKINGSVPAGDVIIDGNDIGGQASRIISDRIALAKHGFVSIVVTINSKNNTIINEPKIVYRGCLNSEQGQKTIEELPTHIIDNLKKYFNSSEKHTFAGIKDNIRESALDFIADNSKVTPIIIPLILNKN